VAKCDGPQSLTFENFRLLMDQVKAINNVQGVPVPA
jgi:3-deoxy-D-arabino-heptulosonate 7-phosphate (DAHP) synthase